MLIVSLLWAGAAYVAGKELIHFVVDEPEPSPETIERPPPPAPPLDEDGGVTASDSSEFDSREDDDRALVLSLGALSLAGAGRLVSPAFGLLSSSVLVIGAYPMLRRTWRNLIDQRIFDFEGLLAVDIVLCIGAGVPGVAALGWLGYAWGRRLIHQTRRRAAREVSAVFSQMGEHAWKVVDGVEVRVRLEDIEVGDRFVIRAGDSVPIDGRVIEGKIAVDQRALTGESRLREFGIGDELLASTTVLGGAAVARTERTGKDTVVARVDALLAETASFEQHLSHRVSIEAERSVRPTLATALAGLFIGGPLGAVAGIWTNAIDSAWLASPYSMLNTIEAAARSSILIKDGRSLEQLVDIDTIVFDKTGTLTLDDFEVASVHGHGDFTDDEILGLAAALEQRQEHPIARAIIDAAEQRRAVVPDVERCTTELGYGLSARFRGQPLVLGSARLLAREGVELPGAIAELAACIEERGGCVVHLAAEGRYAGMLGLESHIRPEAFELVANLRARGLELLVVTGDDEGPTAALTEALGISDYVARALPEDKAEIVSMLRARGRKVCFIGDGINDALALSRANVSVSMSGASPLAMECAQILLRAGSLAPLRSLFEIADHFDREQRFIISSSRLVTVSGAMCVVYAGFTLPAVLVLYATSFGVNLATAMLARLRGDSATSALRSSAPGG
ncbi:MAG: HAD-IC family P-type ATPase [Myxococcota bacterium]